MGAARRRPRKPLPMKGDRIDIPTAVAESHEMISAILTMLEDGDEIFAEVKAKCPLFSKSGNCTGEVPLPPSTPAAPSQNPLNSPSDAAILWAVRRSWTSIPHVWRFILVFCGGGLTLEGIGAWLKHLLS